MFVQYGECVSLDKPHNFPKKLSPEKGARFWYEQGPELIRTKCEGSGGPLSIG